MNVYLENLERIEFSITMCCTGRCRHCSQGDHRGCVGHIDGAKAAEVVEKVCRVYDVKSLMTFGGEPLLYPETVCTIHRAAERAGIPRREIITNGFFSRNKERIAAVARMLAQSGVNRVLLSVDAFHQETIPVETVEFFADCLRNESLPPEIHPAWLESKEADNEYNSRTRELLDRFRDRDYTVSDGNIIFPKGNAVKLLGDGRETPDDPYEEDPRDLHSLCIDADGRTLNRSIYEADIIDIMENYKP